MKRPTEKIGGYRFHSPPISAAKRGFFYVSTSANTEKQEGLEGSIGRASKRGVVSLHRLLLGVRRQHAPRCVSTKKNGIRSALNISIDIGRNYMDHNYMDHNYMGHDYVGIRSALNSSIEFLLYERRSPPSNSTVQNFSTLGTSCTTLPMPRFGWIMLWPMQ